MTATIATTEDKKFTAAAKKLTTALAAAQTFIGYPTERALLVDKLRRQLDKVYTAARLVTDRNAACNECTALHQAIVDLGETLSANFLASLDAERAVVDAKGALKVTRLITLYGHVPEGYATHRELMAYRAAN
jgi:hypothetical protein